MEKKEEYLYESKATANMKLKDSLNPQEIIEERKGFVCL